jgi:hypothetical protein
MKKTVLTLYMLIAYYGLMAQYNYENTAFGIRLSPHTIITSNTQVKPVGITTDEECASIPLTEQEFMALPWYGNEEYLDTFYDSLQIGQGNPTARIDADIEDVWLRVPIKFWVYRDAGNTGDPLPTERGYQRMLDDVNEAFRNNGINIRFYTKCVEFKTVNNIMPLIYM